jgi:general secretion pathway protein I
MAPAPDEEDDRTKRASSGASGFTLVEVLVALAIAGVALAAAYRSVAQSTNTAEAIRARTLAVWVVQNRLAALQLAETVSPGASDGTERQAGTEFWWRERVSTTPNPAFLRVDITAGEPVRPGYALAELVGYVVRARRP